MRCKRAIRGVSKWVCTGALLVLALAMIAGKWWTLRCSLTRHHRVVATVTLGGGVARACRVPMGFWAPTGLRLDPTRGWEWGWSGNEDRVLPGAWHYGFLWFNDPSSPGLFGVGLIYPALLALPPTALLWVWDLRARRRERWGLCPKCGYDRRGLAGAGAPCPECGAAPAPA